MLSCLAKEGDVRVTTGFNRMLGLRGALVRDVAFGQEAVIVTVVLRANLWAASSMYLSATYALCYLCCHFPHPLS